MNGEQGTFMGMADLKGMLRRNIYFEGEFNIYMILAGICGALMLFAFLAFFYNIVMSAGINGVLGIFKPSKLETREVVPIKIKGINPRVELWTHSFGVKLRGI